jgi:uncharacterized protein YjbI with pentapeptide repeats
VAERRHGAPAPETESTVAGAAFVNCTFIGCSFFDARFTDCKLVGSMFERCTFDALEVTGGNWSFVGLPGARCEGAVLRDLDLSGAWLHGAIVTVDQAIVVAQALGLDVRAG